MTDLDWNMNMANFFRRRRGATMYVANCAYHPPPPRDLACDLRLAIQVVSKWRMDHKMGQSGEAGDWVVQNHGLSVLALWYFRHSWEVQDWCNPALICFRAGPSAGPPAVIRGCCGPALAYLSGQK